MPVPRDSAEPEGVRVAGAPVAPAIAPPVSDDALMTRAAAGDRAAWSALVERYLGPISGYAWHMLGDRGEAEDVAQETFLRLMGKVATWDADGAASLKTWLYKVAINLCIDRRRKAQPVPMADPPDVPDDGATQAERNFDRARVVNRAIGRLPERQRAVLALVYYQGFSNIEAAEMLKLSVDAVESLLARARRALRANLEPLRDDLLGET